MNNFTRKLDGSVSKIEIVKFLILDLIAIIAADGSIRHPITKTGNGAFDVKPK